MRPADLAAAHQPYEVTDKLEGASGTYGRRNPAAIYWHIKPRIPEMVAENVSPQFAEVKFQLGGEEFSLPAELADPLEKITGLT